MRDAADDPLDPGPQAGTVAAGAEFGRHHLPNRLAGIAVGDPLFQAVADLNRDAALVQSEEDEQAVVLALLADAAPVVFEHLDRHLADIAERLKGLDRCDDHRVARGGVQRARHAIDLGGALGVYDAGKIVDEFGQLGKRVARLKEGEKWPRSGQQKGGHGEGQGGRAASPPRGAAVAIVRGAPADDHRPLQVSTY